MIDSYAPTRVTLVQIGPLERAAAENTLELANLTQRAFSFSFHPQSFPLSAWKYKLPNSGWDLDTAVRALLRRQRLPRPVIFLTALPYSDRENRKEPDFFYFGDFALDAPDVNVVSTYLWKRLPGSRPLQPYLLLSLAAAVLGYGSGLPIHEETRDCIFDYCDDPADIDRAFLRKTMCQDCEIYLENALRTGRVNVHQVASAKRLLNRAFDLRTAFVVMPFQEKLKPVYDIVQKTLAANNWSVKRADEIARPRRITDAILQAILVSDLVIADLTGAKPNVFYEVGVAHAAGRDVLFLTQERDIPFDLQGERAIIYSLTPHGLRFLEDELLLHTR